MSTVRVVVTGLGIVSPLGIGVKTNWLNLLAGRTGTVALTNEAYKPLPCKVAATIPEGSSPGQLDWTHTKISDSERRTMSRASAFALIAADEALLDANWSSIDSDADMRDWTGVAIGMGMVDLDDIHLAGSLLDKQKYRQISPYFVPRILVNMAAGHVSIKHGFRGPNHAVSTACTTGLHAIGDAMSFIKQGRARMMVCGATEACINPISIAGFSRLRALSTAFNAQPHLASRPFDKLRDGFVMGEGAAILVLESLTHALQRKAPHIYAEILGYGLSADAHHLTTPDPEAKGALLCMQRALDDAAIKPQDIGCLNAHATSTPLGDVAECRAVRQLIGKDRNMMVTSSKGAVGHLLGAAGAVETLFTVLSCSEGKIPPTANLEQSDVDCGFDFVKQAERKWEAQRRIALKNSFGFGGTNASLCIANFSG